MEKTAKVRPDVRPLLLASGSPRRREIVKALDTYVEVVGSGGDEPKPEQGETPHEYVVRLSLFKAQSAAFGRILGAVILGADTSVVLDGDILGKPYDVGEAKEMLEKLRGRSHIVITGVTVFDTSTQEWASTSKSSQVFLRNYSDDEITAYIASGEPFDKAGAYAAQDKDFRPAIRTEGCYLNIVGLPLCEVVQLLGKIRMKVEVKNEWRPPEECVECPLAELGDYCR